MKHFSRIAAVGLVALVGGSLTAQEPADRQRGQRRSRTAFSQNTITMPSGLVDQITQQDEIDANQVKWMEDLAKNFDERFIQLRKEFVDQVGQALTAEQREQLNTMIESRDRFRTQTRRTPSANDPRLFRYFARSIEVTEAQQQQIDVLLAQHKDYVAALGDNQEAIDTYNEQISAQIRGLLDPQQQTKLDEMKERMSRGRSGGGDRGGDRNRGRGRNREGAPQ
jgi:Spy/CpxP family protein refolding chaperone